MAVVAIDVGGTSLKAGILDPSGIAARRHVPSERERGPDAVLGTIIETARNLIAECSDHGLDVDGVGVAVNGIVDDDAGVGVLSVNMGWRDLPVRQHLVDGLDLPVTIRHDVRAGAVAELTFGAAAGTTSALFVPIGTGIAAAIILNGAVVPGASFRAGEIGQINAAPSLTLEDVSSARAIAQRYAIASGVPPSSISAEDVASLVKGGDLGAQAVWHDAIEHLAEALAAAIATLDVELLVIGGGLSRAGQALTSPLRTAISERLPWRDSPPVVPARFADDAGFVGVGIEAWKAAGNDVAELEPVLRAANWTSRPSSTSRLSAPRLGSA